MNFSSPVVAFIAYGMAAWAATAHAESLDLPADVAAAHGKAAIPADSVLYADVTVTFRGNTVLDEAKFWWTPNVGMVRLETVDGTVAVFDGSTAWVTDEDALARSRFHLITWPYFAMMPFKLDDGGTRIELMDDAKLDVDADGPLMRRGKLTFDSGVGDSPDDWYKLYINTNNQLAAAAYTVTYGKTVEEAEADPHAIVYSNFIDVPDADGHKTGVIVSTDWTFHLWNEQDGINPDLYGEVVLTNLRFVDADEASFDKPEGATQVLPPTAE